MSGLEVDLAWIIVSTTVIFTIGLGAGYAIARILND